LASAASIAAIDPFVSAAPRPYNFPLRASAPIGSMVMPATLTVSVCGAPQRFFSLPPRDETVAMILTRPGSTSWYSTPSASLQ
jgi:hypothetical protein